MSELENERRSTDRWMELALKHKRRAEQAEAALEELRAVVFKASQKLDKAYVDALLQDAPPEEKQS